MKLKLLSVFAFLATSLTINAQESFDLVGDTIKVGSNYFGRSVGITETGNLIAVGAPDYYDEGYSGAVFCYEYQDGEWIRERAALLGNSIGAEVQLNDTGDLMLVGSNSNYNFGGVFRVYSYDIYGNWNIEQSINSSTSIYRADLAKSSKSFVVGYPERNTSRGQVFKYYYSEEEGHWMTEELTLPETTNTYHFGHDVTINADGTVIAVADSSAGEVYTFYSDGVNGMELRDTISFTCVSAAKTVDLNSAGDRLIVTGEGDDNCVINAYDLFQGEVQSTKLVASTSTNSDEVSLDNSGNYLSVHGRYNEEGYTRFYKYDGANWVVNNPNRSFSTTSDIALSGDGKSVILGVGNSTGSYAYVLGETSMQEPTGPDTLVISECANYRWNGTLYNVTGVYSQSVGDEVRYLDLTIHPDYRLDTILSSCDSLEWEGRYYNYSGNFTRYFTSIHGCDSIYDLDVTIGSPMKYDTIVLDVVTAAYEGIPEVIRHGNQYVQNDSLDCDTLVQPIYRFVYNPDYQSDTLFLTIENVGVDQNLTGNISIYPNPTSELLIIENFNFDIVSDYTLKIINAIGQEVYIEELSSDRFEIPVYQFGTVGSYIVQVIDGEGNIVESKVLIVN